MVTLFLEAHEELLRRNDKKNLFGNWLEIRVVNLINYFRINVHF